MTKEWIGVLVAGALVSGCATKIEYVERTVYVPVKVEASLFKMDVIPMPPSQDKFIAMKPKNQTEMIQLLRGQRDLLVEYSQDLLVDTGMCRARLRSIRDLIDEQAKTIEKKGSGL